MDTPKIVNAPKATARLGWLRRRRSKTELGDILVKSQLKCGAREAGGKRGVAATITRASCMNLDSRPHRWAHNH